MKRLLYILALLAFAGCSDEIPVSASSEVFIYGDAAENTDEGTKMSMTPVYDINNVRKDGEFEVYLKLSGGTFTVKDSEKTVWTLMGDGTVKRNGGESSASEGLCRIRIDFNSRRWSSAARQSVQGDQMLPL